MSLPTDGTTAAVCVVGIVKPERTDMLGDEMSRRHEVLIRMKFKWEVSMNE